MWAALERVRPCCARLWERVRREEGSWLAVLVLVLGENELRRVSNDSSRVHKDEDEEAVI